MQLPDGSRQPILAPSTQRLALDLAKSPDDRLAAVGMHALSMKGTLHVAASVHFVKTMFSVYLVKTMFSVYLVKTMFSVYLVKTSL